MQKRVLMNFDSCAYSNLSLKESQPKDASGQDGLCCPLNGEIADQDKFCCQQKRDIQDQANYEYIETNPNTNSQVWYTPRDVGSLEHSLFKFSIARLPKWARTKLMDDNLTVTRNNEENMDTNIFCPRQSRWAERLGPDGYRLFTENEEYKTPPATIRPYDCGHRRCFTTQEQPTCSERTPESSFGSHNDKSSASSKGQQSVNKDTHWRTVHTVLYDEIDILEENSSECNGPPLSAANFEKFKERAHINVNSHPRAVNSIADLLTSEMEETISSGNIVNIDSSTDGIENTNGNMFCDVPNKDVDVMHMYRTPQPMCSILSGEVDRNTFSKIGCNNNSYLHISKVPESNFLDNLQPHYDNILSEASSAEDEREDEFCCNKDLFSTHFGSLSTAFKREIGTASARSSFSTRFFARRSSMAQMTLFQTSPRDKSGSRTDGSETLIDQDLSIDDGSLLARESNHLKQLELQSKVVHEAPISCDNSASLTLPSSESSTEVEDRPNSNAGIYDGRVCGNEILEPININNNLGNKFDNSLLCSSHSCVDGKGLLVNLDFKTKDNTEVILEKQDGEMATRQESKIAQELLSPPILISLEREEDLDRDCPGTSCARLVPHDRPAETNISHAKSKESNVNHILMELQQCSSQSHKGSTVDIGDSVENDGSENGCSVHQPDRSGKSGKETVTELQRSLQECKEALINLSDAAEKALNIFSELRGQDTFDDESIHLQSSSGLLDFANGIIQTTVENVHRLRDLALPDHLYKSRQNTFCSSMDTEVEENTRFSVCNFVFSLHAGHQSARSRGCQPYLVNPSEKSLDSVDIEALVERYSERLSHSLSSQVLALIQKGLSSQSET
ncbi:uncharacterized protein LOC131075453 isoform X1 [Cryptomeria japonica]|uniref:uncharacterized protein LOC131075453 isoform X1 n=1 Tax=Cryptomeria japonica TaxID=3369 RepID=UPI0027D9D862|nr:uncharacterized protein LOC131075453 isoform X1 [Cryptomeria japonica]